MFFNGRNDAIKFVEDYRSMILEAKRKEIEGKELKVLTPKQMLQRLPGNNTENLSNEIRQTVYSLYQSGEITKKVYNNIINSTQI